MSIKEYLKRTQSTKPVVVPEKSAVSKAVTSVTESKKHKVAKKVEDSDTLPIVPHMHEGAEGFTDLHRRHLKAIAKDDPARIESMQNWD